MRGLIVKKLIERCKRSAAFYSAGAALILFSSTVIVAICFSIFKPSSFATLGQFGDFVGGVSNPLLALFGFLALLYTIKLQLEELSLSRKELTLTRAELNRSASALEKQNSNLERQRLSQAFFDLFEMYKSVVAEINSGQAEKRVLGKSALASKSTNYYPYSWMSEDQWSVDAIMKTHTEQNDDLGNYYRIIFRLLSFLADQGRADQGREAEFFADMFRAQLSTAELHLLFFNCISEVGRPMQTFASKFELFDNMPIPPGQNFGNVIKEVDAKSFGKNEHLLKLCAEQNGGFV